jgi:hypothetical protein
MKVGDLIKVKDDPTNVCGMGFVYEKDGRHFVKVLWFQECLNEGNTWEQATHFEVIDETQV